MPTRYRSVLLVSLLCLSTAACIAPALWTTSGPIYGYVNHGFLVLGWGWVPRFPGRSPWSITLPWSANLFFVVGLFLLADKYDRMALFFGGAASLVGATIWLAPSGSLRILLGYFLWQAA